MKLIIEYYTPDNNDRNNEYLYCIEKNIESKLFEQIYVFVEEGTTLSKGLADKVNIYEGSRKTIQQLLNFCNMNFSDEICIIANTDIIFDETIRYVNKDNIEGSFLCLTRWDILQDGKLEFYNNETGKKASFSQDAWVFKSPTPITDANFFMGKPGCDGKLSYLAEQKKLDVKNPSKQIIIKHLHNSGYRTYHSMDDRVSRPWRGTDAIDNINKKSNRRILN